MSGEIVLRGISWDHPRAMSPLLATLDMYAAHTPGVRVEWHTRSLAGFADDDFEVLASQYDLLVIDHPFVGDASASGAFLALDRLLPPAAMRERELSSVGPSHRSYTYDGHQWAFAIDAAALVSVVHPAAGTVSSPATWPEVLELGASLRRKGLWMAVPLVATDLVPSLYAIANAYGVRPYETRDRVVDVAAATPVLDMMERLRDLSHPDALDWDPPTLLDRMQEDIVHYSPMLFGYSNYARAVSGRPVLRFGNLPTISGDPVGSTLGGAGIAISSMCAAPEAAADYAAWITSAPVQAGAYVRAGGQPWRIEAWVDDAVDREVGGFFGDTLATLQGAWVRPRVAGYQRFQTAACAVLRRFIEGQQSGPATVDLVNDMWADLHRSAGAH